MPGDRLYLDWAATAPILPCVVEAMVEAMAEVGNPSSIHHAGRQARARLEGARRAIAAVVGVAADDIVLTSGGTEANQLALDQVKGPIVVSAIEHASILEALPDTVRVPVTAAGVVDLGALARILAERSVSLVSVMAANNETGVIQPIGEVARLARAAGALVHCDCVQAFGKMDCSPAALGVDLVTISAHKLGGPPGVGALVTRPRIDIASRQPGGGQERFRRGGTENLPGIVGFAAAASLIDPARWVEVQHLRERLESRLQATGDARIAGSAAPRLPSISCIRSPRVRQEIQLMALDLEGIAVAAGAACSSGKAGPSHVLLAMGQSESEARRAIRVSLGRSTRSEDVDRFAEAWLALHRRLPNLVSETHSKVQQDRV